MAGVKAQVEEECLLRVDRYVVPEEADRFVDDVLAEVIALLPRRVDVMVVVDERVRSPFVPTDEDSVEPVKAPLRRPLIVRSGRARLIQGSEMPFSGCPGGISSGLEHLADHSGAVGYPPPVARKTGVPVRHISHSDRVVVATCHDGGPAR